MSCLIHHGIKGMKWGVRNGPPYPLKSGTKNGWSKSKTKTTNHGHGSKSEETSYTNKSKSGKQRFDTEIRNEMDNSGSDLSNLYGGDLENTLLSQGTAFVRLTEAKGRDYAEKWLRENSKLKEYDYEIRLTESSENGYKWATAFLKVNGKDYQYEAGVEKNYSDDEAFIDRKQVAARNKKIKEFESSKEYRDLKKKQDVIGKRIDEIYDTTSEYWNNKEWRKLEDEWYELADQLEKIRKEKIGDY